MRKLLKVGLAGCGGVLLVFGLLVMYVLSWPDFGGSAEGERLTRMQEAAAWNAEDGGFANDPPPPDPDLGVNLAEMTGDQVRQPPGPFPVLTPRFSEPAAPGLRATWFGHATVLVELDGRRLMTDPILSDHAFAIEAVAPERFNPPPVALADLPPIDVVTISHDHFDHLDMATIQHLAAGGSHFFVGLGIGAHLERWEVAAHQIHELDWWETAEHAGLTIHCTPARHYSGRTSMGNPTLWASWVVEGPEHRVYHSGDTGYAPHFSEIAQRKGPLDLAFIKIGDYGDDLAWETIHMVPEDSVRAHQDLGATTLFPIHWGTFQLSYHPWDAPIERATKAAAAQGVDLVTPRLGETYAHGEPFESSRWWESL